MPLRTAMESRPVYAGPAHLSMTGGHDDVDHPSKDPTRAAKPDRLSDELEEWLTGDGDRTLGALVDAFGEKSFAILFVLLLGVPALPLPTGGATHVFEIIAALIALELIVGRRQVWLPAALAAPLARRRQASSDSSPR